MLDDALIHLRYAAVLHDRHFLSFDGIHPTYGASSLLYVGILALLRSVTHSPLLPKAVSLIAYAGLLGLAFWIERLNRMALALVFVLVSPFAVRWLTDGMETSLACFLAMAFAILLYRRSSPIALASVALCLSLLRVDQTLLVAFGVLLLIDQKQWLRAASVCVGSGLSLAFIQLTMGHLLPDTALAKEGLPFFLVLQIAVHEIAATLSFGLGLCLVWMASAVSAWRVNPRSALICNLPFPVLILLAAAKGQQIHGIRYLVWALLFSITWNLLATRTVPQRRPIFVVVLACALALAWIVEVPIILRVDRGRAQNLDAMEHGHLDQLRGEGLAGDVGYIGYFSQAPICDIDGLVNGRAAALMPEKQRIQACIAAKPSFLFLSDTQTEFLNVFYKISDQTEWLNCGSVNFTNVGGSDHHTLLVRRTQYPDGCPAHL
ncbi:MAG TPA: hypothetical protein VGN01_13115 [Acidobacteriaceae bacterium]|jgi:hypothetical protein